MKTQKPKADRRTLTDADVQHLAKVFATKGDLKAFATKDDLKNFVTKDDLKKELSNYPTKADLKEELKNFVTKDDLKQTEKVFTDSVNILLKQQADLREHFDVALEHSLKAAKQEEVEVLKDRVTRLEEFTGISK